MAAGAATFGEEVKALRLQSGISLREFCRRISWDASNWSKIERGLLAPPQDSKKLAPIMNALEIQNGSEKYTEMQDLANIASGIIPPDLLSDKEVLKSLPMFFRTIRSEKPNAEELSALIERVRKGG